MYSNFDDRFRLYFFCRQLLKVVSEYDQEKTTITKRRQSRGTTRKSRSTITRHQEDKFSKATSSLFPIKMIAILEWT